jgi:small subunit ribosomal protein S21
MPGIRVFADEVIEKAMRRFKKQVEKAGIVSDMRKREHYEKPSIRLKKKSAAARKRELKNKRRFGV